MEKFYITTPIYYVNAAPHIGHTYTTIACDVVKRYKKMQGFDARLTTGTDEHGQKIERSAKKAGKSPQEFTDAVAAEFKETWEKFGFGTDYFQRTTSESHAKKVPTASTKKRTGTRISLLVSATKSPAVSMIRMEMRRLCWKQQRQRQ